MQIKMKMRAVVVSNVTLFTQVSEVNASFLLLSAKQATLEQRRLLWRFCSVMSSCQSHSPIRAGAYKAVSIT